MAITVSNSGIFSRFISMFRSRDPLRKEILRAASILERMLRSLEASKKNLESSIEEHKKRLKVESNDKELAKIIDEEVRNIYGYLSMITKTIYDLVRVKYRLETLFYVEEPLQILPEVLDELRSIEPAIEKINPQLINQIKALEQRVASLMALSSSYIPGISSVPPSSLSTESSRQASEVVKVVAQPPKIEKSATSSVTTPITIAESTREPRPAKKAEFVQALSPTSKHQEEKAPREVDNSTLTLVETNVPLHVIEQWVLSELKVSGGVLDLKLFERKYGVKRDLVLEALRSLEAKNLVRVRRK